MTVEPDGSFISQSTIVRVAAARAGEVVATSSEPVTTHDRATLAIARATTAACLWLTQRPPTCGKGTAEG
jgi:hypothetical protein